MKYKFLLISGLSIMLFTNNLLANDKSKDLANKTKDLVKEDRQKDKEAKQKNATSYIIKLLTR